MTRDNGSSGFVNLLRACAKSKDLYRGTQIHDDILIRGLVEKCSDALVTMYAKCGELGKAKELLDTYKSKDIFSWTDLIAGYAQKGQGQDALSCFKQMWHEGLSPNAVTFTCILKACGCIRAIDEGRQIHNEIARLGLVGDDIVLGNALVDMYVKCGALMKAQKVLEELPYHNVVSWSTLIAGYAEDGKYEEALSCVKRMQDECLLPDTVTFACILKACGNIGATDKGEKIHCEIAREGLLGEDIVLGNALVDMYVKCGALVKAQRVLEELPNRDVVAWSALITGYTGQGQGMQALECFKKMQREGLSPDIVTFVCILKACGSIGATDEGEGVHHMIVKEGLLGKDAVLGNALVDMYAKCGALVRAHNVLKGLPVGSVVAWSALIQGCAEQGKGEQALHCFRQMQHEGCSPNAVTFLCIVKACGCIGSAAKGKEIHDEIARQGFLGNFIVLGNALVDMYAKCGTLTKAQEVLEELPVRDIVAWNALITGFVKQGEGEKALEYFERMQSEGASPDGVTFLSVLKACGITRAAEKGELIHDNLSREGMLGSNVMVGNAVVDMYAKCGALERAQQVLEELPVQDVVSWNTLIAGYAQEGQGEHALNCFERMQAQGLSPDAATFSCILKACGSIGAADMGEHVHGEIVRYSHLRNHVGLINALLDMYTKCGALKKAQLVLDELPVRNAVAWNALMAGYVQQSQADQVLICFERMQRDGLSPNAGTFLCVLSACSHLGLISSAQIYFADMSTRYARNPDLQHYLCMVDLFGHAGQLIKAVKVIQRMPNSYYPRAIWSAMLAACQKWGDRSIARWAFEQTVQVEKCNTSAIDPLASMHVIDDMQESPNTTCMYTADDAQENCSCTQIVKSSCLVG